MSIRLNGSTSGYTEIDAPAVAGSNTLVLPGGNGSDGNILGTDGAGNLSWVNGRMVLATSQASTSGTSVDFTGIPSWVKRITVMFSGVSTSGTSSWLVQLGTSAGVTATGYSSGSEANSSVSNSTVGFAVRVVLAADIVYGHLTVVNLTGNSWVSSHTVYRAGQDVASIGGGTVSLSSALDRIRITTVNGTDTFDAGTINLLLEG